MLRQSSWRARFFRVDFIHPHGQSEKGAGCKCKSVGIMMVHGIYPGGRKVKTWDGNRDTRMRSIQWALSLDRVLSHHIKGSEL